MTINQTIRNTIRTAARDMDCKYRITRDGEVHFYGLMPNSIVCGWWLYAQSVEEAVERAS